MFVLLSVGPLNLMNVADIGPLISMSRTSAQYKPPISRAHWNFSLYNDHSRFLSPLKTYKNTQKAVSKTLGTPRTDNTHPSSLRRSSSQALWTELDVGENQFPT